MLFKLERRPWHADGVKRFGRIEKSVFGETYKKAIMSDRDLPACSSKDRVAVICHHFPLFNIHWTMTSRVPRMYFWQIFHTPISLFCQMKCNVFFLMHHMFFFFSSVISKHFFEVQSKWFCLLAFRICSHLNSIGFSLLKTCKIEVIIYAGTTWRFFVAHWNWAVNVYFPACFQKTWLGE